MDLNRGGTKASVSKTTSGNKFQENGELKENLNPIEYMAGADYNT